MASTAKVSASKTDKKVVSKAVVPAAKKFTPKAKVAVAETKQTVAVRVNGSYEFLVASFAKPVTIVDAAVLLAEHGKFPGDVAAKKVEAFLENAKIDPALEVQVGTGSNAGQYMIARVPQGARRGEKKAVAEKKSPKAAGPVRKAIASVSGGGKFRPSQQAAAIAFLRGGHRTVDAVIAHLAPLFPGKPKKTLGSNLRWLLGNPRNVLGAAGVKLSKQEAKSGEVTYTLVSV